MAKTTKIDMSMQAVGARNFNDFIGRIASERARPDRTPTSSRPAYAEGGVSVALGTGESSGAPAVLARLSFTGTPDYYFDGSGGSYKMTELKSIGVRPVGQEVYHEEDLRGTAYITLGV